MDNYSEESRQAWQNLGTEYMKAMEELGILHPKRENRRIENDYWPVDTSDLELYERK